MQSLRVLERRRAVVRQQLGVVAAQELPHVGRQLALDAAGPERHAVTAFRSRAAASSTSIAASRMKPSDASCGKASSTPYDASACAYSAYSERRPAIAGAPACSRTRTSPVTSSCVFATNASSASRTGEYHSPSY